MQIIRALGGGVELVRLTEKGGFLIFYGMVL